MNSPITNTPFLTNYSKATLWLSIITIIVIPPFSIANLLKGHTILSLICFSFMVLLVLQCTLIRKNRYSVGFTLGALVPAITLYIFFQIYTHGIVGVFWSFPASMVLYFILPLNHARRASVGLLLVNTPLIFIKLEFALATSISLALVMLAVFSGYILSIIENQQNALSREAIISRTQIEDISALLQPAIQEMGDTIEKIDTTHSPKGEDALSALFLKTCEINRIVDSL